MKTSVISSLRRAAPAFTAACALLSGAVAQAQPYLNSISPDGTVQFQGTNLLTFELSGFNISAASISLQLTAMNLDRSTTSQSLTPANGLTITGDASMRTVSAAITSNKLYTAVIMATDSNGTATYTNKFDTITPSYTWELEDWDYDSGKYIDNPQTNAYSGLAGIQGVDCFNPDAGSTAYRPNDLGNCGNEINSDVPRIQFTSAGLDDYDIGWMTAGQPVWANYTRSYPAGKWNVFLRAAGNTGGPEAADFYQGGTNGTFLGRFSVPNSADWQIYTWTPMTDIAGNLIEWDTDGSVKTLTVLNNQGNWNGNFLMLMPVDPNYQPKPFISNFSPDASKNIFPTNTAFTFDVNSVPGITADNVVVTVNGMKPYGLTITGSGHVLHGSFPLAPNVAYHIAIQMTDANGASSYSADFGTYPPTNYTWECEDWDYEGGQFIDNPQTNAYANLSGYGGVDANNSNSGSTAYRGNDTGNLGNEVAGDLKRAQYATGNDYDIGWTTSGVWANYTRTYPKGMFNVVMRASGNTGGNDMARLLEVTSGLGTDTQTTFALGQFNVPNTGAWQTYSWAPLVDSSGNLAVVTNSGSVKTFQMYEDNSGFNANFYMLIPVDTIRPTITQIYPNNQAMYQPTNRFSFVVSSSIPVNSSLVTVTLNGVVVPNLVFSGSPTSLTVSYANLQPQTAYWGSIAVNTTNNDPYYLNVAFNTLSSTNFTVEAEDFDYEGGKFVDSPAVTAYASLTGVDGIDAHNVGTAVGTTLRPADAGNLGNEATGDYLRTEYDAAGTNDFDIGWTAAGQWGNYTRTYPGGVYNVMLRASSPGGQTDAATFQRVTSGAGTANQTTASLGRFNVPNTGGWQTYTFVPLVDANNNLVTVTNKGGIETFRLAQDNGNWNANFFMLVPAQSASEQPKLAISRSASNVTISWTPGGGTLYYSSALGSGANWQPAAGSANPMTIPIGSAPMFYRVQ